MKIKIKMKITNNFLKFLLLANIIFLAFLLLPLIGSGNNLELLLSALAITYAIIAGFVINRLKERYGDMVRLVSVEDSGYRSLLQYARILGTQKQIVELEKSLQNYYKTAVADFNEAKFEKSLKKQKSAINKISDTAEDISNFVLRKKKLTDSEVTVFNRFLITLETLDQSRLEFLNRYQMTITKRDWGLLTFLSSQIIVVLFFFRTESVMSNIILSMVAISVIFIIYMIVELQKMRINDRVVGEDSSREVLKLLQK